VQLTATAHAADNIHDPTIAAVNAASLSLLKADIGWKGPIGCVRMGLLEVEKGKGDVFVVNPTVEQLQHSKLDLVYAGTAERPLMMECVANEVPEAQMRQAMQVRFNYDKL
jgi:polyribonucleotide nucleotidyltransferase